MTAPRARGEVLFQPGNDAPPQDDISHRDFDCGSECRATQRLPLFDREGMDKIERSVGQFLTAAARFLPIVRVQPALEQSAAAGKLARTLGIGRVPIEKPRWHGSCSSVHGVTAFLAASSGPASPISLWESSPTARNKGGAQHSRSGADFVRLIVPSHPGLRGGASCFRAFGEGAPRIPPRRRGRTD